MYFEHIQQYIRMLENLVVLLYKAEQFVKAGQIEESVLLQSRLAPDMFPFLKQVQACCDLAKLAASRLSGQPAPRHEDTEQTLADLKVRLHQVLDYLGGFKSAHFAEAENRQIVLAFFPDQFFTAEDYLLQYSVPNFYFHLSMAYGLLRQAGLAIGKQDFLGALRLQPLAPQS